MASERTKSKVSGVRYREHATRKNGIQKDRYYIIHYPLNKKQKEEGGGWASEGWTEKKAAALLFEIKENIRKGVHPRSLAEMRAMNEEAAKKQEEKKVETLAETITLHEVFEQFIAIYKTRTAKKTWIWVQGLYANYIQNTLGARKIINITVDDIQPIIINALKVKAPRTVDYIKATLRLLFNCAKDRDLYFKENPAMKIKIKLKDNKRNRFLTQEETRILLNELKKHSIQMHDIALFSLYEGARAGAIFALQWKDIDWGINRITLLDTKNGETYFQPMHPVVRKMLEHRYAENKEGLIFKSRDGKQIKDLSKTYQRVIDKLGFNDGITDPRQKIVFHTLRHTYTSWLVMGGVDLYTTQKLMGHKSNQMTQRYAHLAPGHLENAISVLKEV